MTDLQPGWDAAITACLTGHEDCTFGGMTPASGYWLAAEGCDRNHGSTCAWCPAEATTGFAGWGEDGWSLWQVPACEEHGAAWAVEHPEWSRDAEPKPRKTVEELLSDMDPFKRAVTEAHIAAMEEALLGCAGPTDGPHEFGGLLAALGAEAPPTIAMPYPKAAPPGPPRQRYDPVTKSWEAV